MTQKEAFTISAWKNDCYDAYLNYCSLSNEVPRQELIISIKEMNTEEGLKKLNDIFIEMSKNV